MTPRQIEQWLCLKSDQAEATYGSWKEICDGMKDLPVPVTPDQHIATFAAFLASAQLRKGGG